MASWACNVLPSSHNDTKLPPGGGEVETFPVDSAGREYVPHSLIVKLRDTPASTSKVWSAHGSLASIKGTIEDRNKDGIYDRFAAIAKGRLALVELDRSTSTLEALDVLQKDPAVEYAHLNYVKRIDALPNDARIAELWGMHNAGQTGGEADADIDAIEAWDISIGDSRVVVAVIDTGINYNHEDLAANMWRNPGEIPGNGMDDDGNGYIDDIHGIDVVNGDSDPMDDNGHGSHCAGIIGAVGGNGIGVAGVSQEVSLIGLKFLTTGGNGSTAGVIEAINWAVDMNTRLPEGRKIRVLSNSWGGGGFEQALEDAITASYDNNGDNQMLFVAAAGNSSSDNDASPHYPSSYTVPNVIAVAATDHNDRLASFSSFGQNSVDLAAPGVNVLSTTLGNDYEFFGGTSMATPQVSGAAALMLSIDDSLSVSDMVDILLTSGDHLTALEGITVSENRLNLKEALDATGPAIPRFTLAAGPGLQVINQGDRISYRIDIGSLGGFTDNVNLNLTSSPPLAATTSFTANPAVSPGSSTLDISTDQATAVGTYNLTITGTDVGGTLTKTRQVKLRVRPSGTVDNPFPCIDCPIDIPDNNAAGIISVINVQETIAIQEVAVDVDITHTAIGDLVVTLSAPDGTTVDLHRRAGGSATNLVQSYRFPDEFINRPSAGKWTLFVSDNDGFDTGTLNNWTLHLIGVPDAATFGLSASQPVQSASQGDSATYDISVVDVGGFIGTVNLSATADTSLTTSIAPTSTPVPGSAALTVGTSQATPPGDYTITVTGDDGTQTRIVNVTLTVTPLGQRTIYAPCSGTPVAIPDNDPTGVAATIPVQDDLIIANLTAHVVIAHTFVGDLRVALTSPQGTEEVLHNRTGRGSDNIDEMYVTTSFTGEHSLGDWTMHVSDNASFDTGTLEACTLIINGAESGLSPAADSTVSGDFLDQ